MYIKRDNKGAIEAVSRVAVAGFDEHMEDSATELQAFYGLQKSGALQSLEQSDQAMARVLEDVIGLLIEKGVIRFTDLPEAAQTKLMTRRELRGQRQGIDLLDDGNEGLGL